MPLFALGSEPIKLSCEQCQRLLGGLRRGGLLLTGLATELKSFVAALFKDRGDLIDKALRGHLTPPPYLSRWLLATRGLTRAFYLFLLSGIPVLGDRPRVSGLLGDHEPLGL